MAIDISGLNEPQRDAVLSVDGPLLVLAGAGSGKTSVLTYRIAHMVEDLNIAPWEILAITFTNKAANEMKERIGKLIGSASSGMWVLTFHKCCGRIIRANPDRVGLKENFTIYDSADQKSLVKQICKDMYIDDKKFSINSILSHISSAKNDLVSPEDYARSAEGPLQDVVAKVFCEYQKRLLAINALDFDDMLVYGYKLLSENPDLLAAYQDRFKYLLVDEYQDTNHVQYEICRLLASKHKNIMVVGDDDQSIYSWRGADISNILNFERDYKSCKTVKLEENYRSSGNILNAANAVIAKNFNRKSKRLFTSSGDGEKVGVYCASDERDEGRWIAGEIDKSLKRGEISSYNDVAILYRTNAQSRTLEDMMLRSGIPYKIVGGTKFFERKEIKDVMAYLSLATNTSDDIAFERVINTPKRGLGSTTIEKVRKYALENSMPLFASAVSLAGEGEFRQATRDAMVRFVVLIDQASRYSGELRDIVGMIVDKSGMIDELEAQNTDEAKSRIENIKEFYTVVSEYSESHISEPLDFEAPNANDDLTEAPQRSEFGNTLVDFLEWVRLRTDLDALSEGAASVTLMTCHAAKGLEFEHVYVAGMEEGIFPGVKTYMDMSELEEERRLAYVAITRAKKRLVLTHASSRRLYGMTEAHAPSQFLREIPEEFRESMGVGSAGFEGVGWEKRGSRRGISGSGTDFFKGRVSNVSSTSYSRGSKRAFTFEGEAGVSSNGAKTQACETGRDANYCVNDYVEHKTFGRGRVVAVDGDKLSIKFDRSGQVKTLLRDYAPIVKV